MATCTYPTAIPGHAGAGCALSIQPLCKNALDYKSGGEHAGEDLFMGRQTRGSSGNPLYIEYAAGREACCIRPSLWDVHWWCSHDGGWSQNFCGEDTLGPEALAHPSTVDFVAPGRGSSCRGAGSEIQGHDSRSRTHPMTDEGTWKQPVEFPDEVPNPQYSRKSKCLHEGEGISCLHEDCDYTNVAYGKGARRSSTKSGGTADGPSTATPSDMTSA